MNPTTPDRWVVIKINNGEETFYKVLAGWSGGYLDGDSWRLNSGIKSVIENPESFDFVGSSGSVYRCHKAAYGITNIMASILAQLEDHAARSDRAEVQVMDENTDWCSLKYEL